MPETINNKSWRLPLGGEAVLVANAIKGKGQGLWKVTMITTSLNIIAPAYDIKAGAYTGEIT
ncbi:WxL domain-containing protein, partial [Enterococcus faecalis]